MGEKREIFSFFHPTHNLDGDDLENKHLFERVFENIIIINF